MITRDTRPGLSRSGKTHNILQFCRANLLCQALEAGCRVIGVPLDAEQSAKSAFSAQNTQKKRDILSEKRESGMALKKREFTPESGSVDTYDILKFARLM